jgi:hypothetical protein
MSAMIPERPDPSLLSRVRVGAPVSAHHGRHWANNLAFLLGRNTHMVCNQVFGGNPFAPKGVFKTAVAYRPQPYVKTLYVEIEMGLAAASGGTSGILCTASSGTIGFVGDQPRLLDESLVIPSTNVQMQNQPIYSDYIDVRQLPIGTTMDLIFEVKDVGAKPPDTGIYRLSVLEVPLADSAPIEAPTTEIGVDPSWPQSSPPRQLVAGATNHGKGFVRLLHQLDLARSGVRRWRQITTSEKTTFASGEVTSWQITSTSTGAAIDWDHGGAVVLRCRNRHLYTVGGTRQPEACKIKIRHNGTIGATLRAVVTPLGGSAVNTDVALSSTGGSWTSTEASLNMPNTNSFQECTVTFQGWNGSAGTHHVSQIAIYTDEA